MEQHYGYKESIAGKVRHGQHLARAIRRIFLAIPETHQEDAAKPCKLPTEVQQEKIGGVNQMNHFCNKQEHQ
jgi:hypothetical protein